MATRGALWGHLYDFWRCNSRETSVWSSPGKLGLGGGIIIDGNVVKGRMGFGGEMGHVLIPYQSIAGIGGLKPPCNCGRTGDLESVCSLTAIERTLLPFFLTQYPGHELGKMTDLHQAAKVVVAWQTKATPCAARSFACRLTAWGFSWMK